MSSDRYEEISSIMVAALKHRELKPGSTGWTVVDLRDPAIERQWDANHYEMIRGVIAEMPPAMFDHGYYAQRLMRTVENYFDAKKQRCYVSYEVDILIDEDIVDKADAVLMLQEDVIRQRQAWSQWQGQDRGTIGRLLVPPTLIVESISQGHEARDRIHKRNDYERFGVANYWIIDGLRQSLTCLALTDGTYVEDANGLHDSTLKPSAFPGLVISLKDIFL